MENSTQTKTLNPLLEQREPEPLTPVAQRLKERLSHIPLYANKAQGGNDYWNSLASSSFNVDQYDLSSETPPEITHPSGIARTIISKKELVELFKAETKKLEIFNKIYMHIKTKVPDETGCNWTLNVSNEERDVLIEFCERMQPFTASMREKYNTPSD